MEPGIDGAGTTFFDITTIFPEHNNLLGAIDRFQAVIICDEPATNTHIGEFVSEVYRQFQYEERLMEIFRYPLTDIHTLEHNRIMTTITAVMKSTRGSRFPVGQIAEKLRVICGVHAEHFDLVLAAYLKKKYAS